MAPIILSDSLCGELEDFVLRTPSAKERCRAQAVLWLAEGLSAEQVAETFQVSRQTVYNWVNRFLRRDDLDLRARLLDAPRSGRPPSIAEIIDLWIAAAFAGDPRESGYQPRSGPPSCCSTTWSTLMGSRPPSRASAWRSHAWVSAGNGPGMSWRRGRRLKPKQKGAETRPEGSHAQGNLDAGRDDRHGDTSAV